MIASEKTNTKVKWLIRTIGVSKLYWSANKTVRYQQWLKYQRRGSELIRNYIQRCYETKSEIWLQIGSGGKALPGWLNTDYERYANCAFLDATQPWPFADGELDLIFAEHVIANLSKTGGIVFFQESYRCLKPGGILRLSTPNLTTLSQVLISDAMDEIRHSLLKRHSRLYRQNEEISFCDLINDIHYLWGHKYLYTEDELCKQLRLAGFIQLEKVNFGQSRDPRLRGIEQHQAGLEMAYIDLIIEAIH